MTDFAPIDGRVGLGGAGGASDALSRGRVSARSVEAGATPRGAARQIVDEVQLSDDALAASGGLRPDVVSLARDRLAAGFYDDPRVIDQAIDGLIRELAA